MNNEMLAMLDYLESERGIQRDALIALIEDALLASAAKSLHVGDDVKVKIDSRTGDIRALAMRTVAAGVPQAEGEVSLKDVSRRMPDAKVGDVIEWEVTTPNFGRIAAQAAKQAIMQRLRQAEKVRVSEEFRERLNQLVSGIVRRVEKGDVYIDFQRAEGIMRHTDRIPGEEYVVGDHIAALLIEVNAEGRGPCLVVSRAHPDFVKALFEREVSEISENLVIIKGTAREPGYRTKIAVHSDDPRVDPVGACVGIRGNRVKTVVRELGGEKVDIIRWDADIRTYVGNALQPAKLAGVEVDQPNHEVKITVPEDQLSLAIGKKGQNVRLANKLTGWRIEINRMEKPPEEMSMADKANRAVDALARIPGIGPDAAAKLVSNGFNSLEGIVEGEIEDLAQIDGFDLARATEIFDIAKKQLGG